MLITTLVFLLIAVLIAMAAWRSLSRTKISSDNRDQPNLEFQHHKLKEAAIIEAAQELHPFAATKGYDVQKTETGPKKSHIQAVPDNVEKMVKKPLAVPHKAEEKAKSSIQTAPNKAEAKAKSPVIAVPHKAEEKVKKTVQAAIPALSVNNEIVHQQNLNQSISSVTAPVSLEKQLDNIEVTENALQTNVYNELVKQLTQTSVILKQINEQIKLVELMNYIDDEFTKLNMTMEHQ